MHTVVNERLCLKVAFDYVPAKEESLVHTAVAWHTVVSPIMAQRSAEDCVQVLPRTFRHFVSSMNAETLHH